MSINFICYTVTKIYLARGSLARLSCLEYKWSKWSSHLRLAIFIDSKCYTSFALILSNLVTAWHRAVCFNMYVCASRERRAWSSSNGPCPGPWRSACRERERERDREGRRYEEDLISRSRNCPFEWRRQPNELLYPECCTFVCLSTYLNSECQCFSRLPPRNQC